MHAATSATQWTTIYAVVGTAAMIITLVGMAVRPVAGRTRRVAAAAAKLAFDSAEAAAKLTVEAAGASTKLASDNAAAAAQLNLEAAVRNVTLDARLDALVSVQEGHESRLTVLERGRGAA